ncbi:MAG: zinc-dependent alcohol dehydrogenase family protein [Gammaproteobacteria bacterium]|nr:zinc-dependent alcohol dehydrogenase family protein [Gammaproteobacteria bacterium]
MKMRAAVLYEQGKPRPFAESRPLVVETVDLDPPGPDEVLVELRAAGLCHSDLSSIDGVRKRDMPMVPGHEAAGIVREVGAGVVEAVPGDHVVMSFVSTCGHCEPCRSGRPNLCDSHWQARNTGALLSGARRLRLGSRFLNHASGISAFAEYAVVSRHAVIPIDVDIPFEDAALFGCAVMTGVGAVVNTAGVAPGCSVAVVGLGGVGLSAMLGAMLAGARRVIAVDVNAAKLGLARQLGATDVFDAGDEDCAAAVREATGGGVDFAFEMAGAVPAMELAYATLRRGGTVVSAGLSDHRLSFSVPHAAMVSDEKTIKGSYMGSCVPRRDVPRFLALYRDGRLPVDRLRSGNIGLEDLNAGFDRLADGDAIRQILTPHA